LANIDLVEAVLKMAEDIIGGTRRGHEAVESLAFPLPHHSYTTQYQLYK